MATFIKKRAADYVPPASPPHPPREKTTVRISPMKPPPRLGLPCMNIAHDLIPNILIRLPPRSVARFRSVCKYWLAVISDPDFIDAHLQAAKQRPSLLMAPTTSRNDDRSLPLLMGFYKYHVGGESSEPMHPKKLLCGSMNMRDTPVHCDGMILITARSKQMMICNPATGEAVRLPRPCHGAFNDLVYYTHLIPFTSRTGLGLDPRSNKYKAARFFYQYTKTGVNPVCKFQVLTLGGTNQCQWRQTADDPPYPMAARTPVHVQGSIYWMLTETPPWRHRNPPPHAFLRFSLADEKFSLVPFPPSDYKPARFVPSESQLCCTCFCEQKKELEVWSLRIAGRDDNPAEWTRRCTVVIGSELVLLDLNALWRSPKVVLHGSTLILTAEQKVYQYDMDTNRMEKIASDIHQRFYEKKNLVLHLTNYVESLVRINDL